MNGELSHRSELPVSVPEPSPPSHCLILVIFWGGGGGTSLVVRTVKRCIVMHSFLKHLRQCEHPPSVDATPYPDTTMFDGVALGGHGVAQNAEDFYV